MADFNYEEKTLLNLKDKYEQLIKMACHRRVKDTPIENYYNRLYEVEALLGKINNKYINSSKLEEDNHRLFIIDFNEEKLPVDLNILEELKNPLTFYNDEEINSLLNWTVNNTRNNIKNSNFGDNDDLEGVCGFAQFSSLYPLEELDLKITINNAGSFTNNKLRHAFGTVTFPVLKEDEIEEETYLIDITYSQFFLLNQCVENLYLKGNRPKAGYFVKDDPGKLPIVKELLEKGYIKLTEENIKKVYYGLYLSCFDKSDLDQAKKDFEELNLTSIIKEKQEIFDYSPEEFRIWGNIIDIEDSIPQSL